MTWSNNANGIWAPFEYTPTPNIQALWYFGSVWQSGGEECS